MKIRFTTQAVIGTRVYGLGEAVDADGATAAHAIRMKYAVAAVEPASVQPPAPVVREAVSSNATAARKAVKR